MLYDFQQRAVDFHLAHHYTLNASEMGLGKSRMALVAAKETRLRTAVFAPKFLQSSWEREGVEVGQNFSFFPYSMLHKVKLHELKDFGFWVADEVHFLKSPTATRTHAFYSLIKGILPDYFVGLTGTPIKNRLPDFWTLLAFCSLNPKETNGLRLAGEMKKYRAFSRHFCHSEIVKAGGARFERFGAVKDEMIPELKGLLRGKFIRFKVDEVLKDLPPFTAIEYFIESLKPDPELDEIFTAYCEGRKFDSAAKAKSALLKAGQTVEYVKSMRENGVKSIVVFTDHIESAKRIAMGLDVLPCTGQTPAEARGQMVSAFQGGKLKTIVATIGSLSIGVTLTRASHVVFNDLSWTPSDNTQAMKRIHRIGQGLPCFAHYIYATPTDQHIKKTLDVKQQTISKVVG